MEPVLELESVNASDGGSYECVVANNAGFEIVEANLSVAPVFVEQPFDRNGVINEMVEFTCQAVSFPYPYYQWQRYAQGQFEDISGADASVLTFTVASDSFGLYRCMAGIPGAAINSTGALLTGNFGPLLP